MYRPIGATATILLSGGKLTSSGTGFEFPSVNMSAAKDEGPTLQALQAKWAAEKQAAINSGAVYNPAADSSPRMVLPGGGAPQGPQPVFYDMNGQRYTAPPGSYIGHDPAYLFCQAGNKPPCACATQEAKNAILQQGLCQVGPIPSNRPAIRGVGSVYSAYVQSVYSAYGRPTNTFKWYDKWFSQAEGFNPCDVLRLPTCAVDCNGPMFEPERLSGEYGWCKSTRVVQTPGTPYSVQTAYAPTVKSTYSTAPNTGWQQCAPGTHFTSGGCVPDKPIETLIADNPPAPATGSSSMMTGAWWLLLLAAAGGAYYLSTKKKGK